jgi:hypothetical protein
MLLVLAAASATAVAKDEPKTWDGLELRPTKGLDLVYVRPGATLKGYTQVLLAVPVEVAFDKNWDPNADVRGTSGRLSASDIQRIKDEMSTEFRKVFIEELIKGGYTVVDLVGENTLRASAALSEVHINAPEKMQAGRATSYTLESGRMTLAMELRDGPTAQLIARIVDEKIGNSTGQLQVTNSLTNSADFRRAVRSWTRQLVKALDKVNGQA